MSSSVGGGDLFDYAFKVLLVGDAATGKSSILLRFADDTFDEEIGPTIGVDFKKTELNIDDKKVSCTIWDTAGQERFRTLTSGYYRNAKGIILVYDVNNKKSFQNIEEWLTEVNTYSTHPVIKMLVGNKIDLKNREVSLAEGQAFARKHGMLFIECSAKTKEGVLEAFDEVVHKILDTPALLENAQPMTLSAKKSQSSGGCC